MNVLITNGFVRPLENLLFFMHGFNFHRYYLYLMSYRISWKASRTGAYLEISVWLSFQFILYILVSSSPFLTKFWEHIGF